MKEFWFCITLIPYFIVAVVKFFPMWGWNIIQYYRHCRHGRHDWFIHYDGGNGVRYCCRCGREEVEVDGVWIEQPSAEE